MKKTNNRGLMTVVLVTRLERVQGVENRYVNVVRPTLRGSGAHPEDPRCFCTALVKYARRDISEECGRH